MADDTADTANEPYGRRRATSHEEAAGTLWDTSYQDGPAPWDTGRPQPSVVRLVADDAFAAPVLDAGCGTGENALHIAQSGGLEVLGVDVAQTALATARQKAAARGIDAEFVVADGLQLATLDRTFQTVLDCGLLHTFDQDERTQYIDCLAAVTTPGSVLYVLCFSDLEPGTGGPHRLSELQLRQEFAAGGAWQVASVQRTRFETNLDSAGAQAWLVRVDRI